MLKITGKLLILALCLSLVAATAFADPTEGNPNEGTPTIESEKINTTSQGDSDLINSKSGDTQEGATSNAGNTKAAGNAPTANQDAAKEDSGVKDVASKQETPQQNPKADEKKDGGGNFYIILIMDILLSLLIVLCLIVLWNMNNRLRKVERASKGNDSSASKESAALVSIEKKIAEIENVIGELRQTVREMYPFFRNNTIRQTEKPSQESSPRGGLSEHGYPQSNRTAEQSTLRSQPSLSRGGFGRNSFQKDLPANTSRQTQQFNKRFSDSERTVESNNRTITDSQWSDKMKEITAAFNKMMRYAETIPLNKTYEVMTIRQNFMKDYQVTPFNCTNSQERINESEIPPQFATCGVTESTLWGIKLSDGYLAVLPSPTKQYESTAHKYGGLKEIFESSYRSGSYRQIEVISPAIMTTDFQIKQRGVLRLIQD